MHSNFHTHSVFCDGDNTPEEVVLAAIEKGFSAIGFSGHGFTGYDERYCMKDTEGYIAEIKRLKEKYKKDIEVYLGVEEDAFYLQDRSKFDYIIGSSHYFVINGEYHPIDSSPDYFKKCLDLFNYDIPRMAESYYSAFCEYINRRKPDIIGHFDLITKYDELDESLFLKNDDYNKVAKKYLEEAAKSGCIFEVNTGAISRGMRTTPYPDEKLLYILKKNDARLILSADSHNKSTIDFGFSDAKTMLRNVGFKKLYTIKGGKFVAYDI